MTRTHMLILWSNDAITLAHILHASPCYLLKGSTRSIRSNIETALTEFYKVTDRHYTQVEFIHRHGDLSTIQERLEKLDVLPSMKIHKIGIVIEYNGALLSLYFERSTLKKYFSTDRELFKYADGKIKSVFTRTLDIYANLGITYAGHKPSFLVLTGIGGDIEDASMLDVLSHIVNVLQLEKNELSMMMVEIVERTEEQTGVYVYSEFTEE